MGDPTLTAPTATRHVPDEREHVAPLGNETIPTLGLTCEKVMMVPSTGAPPTIEALQFVDEPTTILDSPQETATPGDALLTVIVVGGDVLGLFPPSPL
ncbi:MAG TPA: hypothetical protein VGS04_08115 [Nitrososphaerales archaeon]|nr:hypothetical protein [Nitrososphaerales archaeon]